MENERLQYRVKDGKLAIVMDISDFSDSRLDSLIRSLEVIYNYERTLNYTDKVLSKRY